MLQCDVFHYKVYNPKLCNPSEYETLSCEVSMNQTK